MVVAVFRHGGLGNQLFQYAAARAVAHRNNSQLTYDLADHRSQQHARPFALDRFAIRARHTNRIQNTWWRVQISPKLGIPRRIINTIVPGLRAPYLHDRMRGFQPEVTAYRGRHAVLNGNWESDLYFRDCADVIREEFVFRDPPSAVNAALLGEISSCASVALHVRRGDKLKPEWKDFYAPTPLDYYQRGADTIRRQDPDLRFFIFSDDPDWAESNLALPGRMTVVRNNQHANHEEDLRLMAACKHFIISVSTFSWWGAWLSRRPGKIVIAPRDWYAPPELAPATRDVIPAEWARIANGA